MLRPGSRRSLYDPDGQQKVLTSPTPWHGGEAATLRKSQATLEPGGHGDSISQPQGPPSPQPRSDPATHFSVAGLPEAVPKTRIWVQVVYLGSDPNLGARWEHREQDSKYRQTN